MSMSSQKVTFLVCLVGLCFFVGYPFCNAVHKRQKDAQIHVQKTPPTLMSEEEKPCDQEKVYDDLIRVMGELGDMKEICGHIENIEYIIACRYPYGSFRMYSCQSAAEEIEEIDSWLTQYRNALNVSCIKDKACHHWAQTALSWDYRLILE